MCLKNDRIVDHFGQAHRGCARRTALKLGPLPRLLMVAITASTRCWPWAPEGVVEVTSLVQAPVCTTRSLECLRRCFRSACIAVFPSVSVSNDRNPKRRSSLTRFLSRRVLQARRSVALRQGSIEGVSYGVLPDLADRRVGTVAESRVPTTRTRRVLPLLWCSRLM